jgi:hypothetical protein
MLLGSEVEMVVMFLERISLFMHIWSQFVVAYDKHSLQLTVLAWDETLRITYLYCLYFASLLFEVDNCLQKNPTNFDLILC